MFWALIETVLLSTHSIIRMFTFGLCTLLPVCIESLLCSHFRVKERLMEILNEDREFIVEDDDRVRYRDGYGQYYLYRETESLYRDMYHDTYHENIDSLKVIFPLFFKMHLL